MKIGSPAPQGGSEKCGQKNILVYDPEQVGSIFHHRGCSILQFHSAEPFWSRGCQPPPVIWALLYSVGKGFRGQWPPPQVGQKKGRYGLVVKQQFSLGKAVVRKHHLRQVGESQRFAIDFHDGRFIPLIHGKKITYPKHLAQLFFMPILGPVTMLGAYLGSRKPE